MTARLACPHCSLLHLSQADGRCPRCHRAIEAPAGGTARALSSRVGRWVTVIGVVTFILEVGGVLVAVMARLRSDGRLNTRVDYVLGPDLNRLLLYAALAVLTALWLTTRAAERRIGQATARDLQPDHLWGEARLLLEELWRSSPLLGRGWILLASTTALLWMGFLLAFRWQQGGWSPEVLAAEVGLGAAAALVEFSFLSFVSQVASPQLAVPVLLQAAPQAPITVQLRSPPPEAPAPLVLPTVEGGAGCCVACEAPLVSNRCSQCGATATAGGFRILKLLGQRAYSRTYLARAPDGSHAVLKELLFASVPDTLTLEAFDREAAVLGSLRHLRVPRFLRAFREGNGPALRCYLAMACVEGAPLDQLLTSGPFPEPRVAAVARDVLEVLAYLHSRTPRVLHRDIKPSNLVEDVQGRIHVVDFGASRDVERTVNQGTLVGTVGFMAPEQLAGQVDPTTDLYSLGTTLVCLLTGAAPSDLMQPNGAIALPSTLRASKPFVRFLKRLTAARRADRFQSAEEALAALMRV